MQQWSLHRIIPAMIVLAGLVVILSQYLVAHKFAAIHSRQLTEERLIAVGSHFQTMSVYLLAQGDLDVLREGIASADEQPNLELAMLTDPNSTIIAATDPLWINKRLSDTPWAASAAETVALPDTQTSPGSVAQDLKQPRILELQDSDGNWRLVGSFAVPFPVGSESDQGVTSFGAETLFLHMDMLSPWQSLLDQVRRVAIVSSAVVVAVALMYWFAMNRIVSQPVYRLADKSRRYSSGNFNAATHLQHIKELGEISTALDTLAFRAKAGEEAHSANARLLDIVEHSINEIYVVDAQDFRLLSANREAREKHGFSIDLQPISFPWRFSPNLSKSMLEEYLQPLREGLKDTQSFESRFLSNDERCNESSFYDVEVTLQLIESVPPEVLLIIVRDISETKRQLEHLILRERAMDALQVGVCISDATKPDYPIVYTNAYLSKLSGYSTEELLGQPARILQGPKTDQTVRMKIEKAQSNGEYLQVRLDSTRKDGTTYKDELSLSPVSNSVGVVTHYVGINDDISSELASEQQLIQVQRFESIGQLSGGIAHDFNNILAIVLGNIELLAMELTDEHQLELVAEAERAAQMGRRLTSRLLSFAKRASIESTTLDLNRIVMNSMELIRSSLGDDVTVDTTLEPALWAINNDQSQIENAIINLVINARDAITHDGVIVISTANVSVPDGDKTVFNDAVDGNYVELSVADNGAGMTPEVKRHALDPFYTTKAAGVGTGLGLSTIFGFVRHSGGQMLIESEPGEGARIRLLLPCAQPTHAEHQPALPLAVVEPLSRARQVLLVEDDASVRKVTAKRLQALNYDTVAVSSAREAILKLQDVQPTKRRFDIVMTDVAMERETSGYELASWVIRNQPGCAVLLCTAYATEKPADLRDIPLLSKPYSLDELKDTLMQSLQMVRR